MRFSSIVVLLIACILPGYAFADLPSLITTIYSDTNGTYFGQEIVPLGDQNGDGYDDFLTIDARRFYAYMYLGGNPGDSLPKLTFESAGTRIGNIGDWNNDGFNDFVIPTRWFVTDMHRDVIHFGGPEADTTRDFWFGLDTLSSRGPVARGLDVNGDGIEELFTSGKGSFHIQGVVPWYNLTASPDSIPDGLLWPYNLQSPAYMFGDAILAGDFNGDGQDDLAVNLRYQEVDEIPGRLNLYWGGPSFDSIPDLVMIRPGGFDVEGDQNFGADAAILGDVNGDGYVDLWVGNRYNHADSLRCIYFGGPDIDAVPDVILPFLDVCDRGMPAGDVNHDGYDDLMTGFTSPYSGLGWVRIYYGGPEMDNVADVIIDVVEMPGYQFHFAHGFGPLGDYNGDGIDDFGVASWASSARQVIYIFSGWVGTTDVTDDPDGVLPSGFVLHQNYPNPFNAGTMIRFEVPLVSTVRLAVYDVLGREVRELLHERVSAGSHEVMWDGSAESGEPAASGVYFYTLRTGSFEETKKMLLVK